MEAPNNVSRKVFCMWCTETICPEKIDRQLARKKLTNHLFRCWPNNPREFVIGLADHDGPHSIHDGHCSLVVKRVPNRNFVPDSSHEEVLNLYSAIVLE
jgi:hypothetical protein